MMNNSRLIFIETSSPNTESSRILEEIDHYLDQSKYLKALNVDLIMYGEKGATSVKLGREIHGREEEAYHLERIKLSDFSIKDSHEHVFEISDMNSLVEKVNSFETDYKNYRIEIKLSLPQEAKVTFF